MVDFRSAGGHLASLAWVAVRAFAGTVLVLTATGVLLAGLSFYFLREYHLSYAAGAFSLALAEAVAVGIVLGGKRAMAMAFAHALGVLRVGRSLVRLIFE